MSKGKAGERNSISATSAARSGRKKKTKRKSSYPSRQELLIAATGPMLEFISVANDVFTEDDALSPPMRQVSLGRLYRGWKDMMEQMDPDFDRKRDTRVKRHAGH